MQQTPPGMVRNAKRGIPMTLPMEQGGTWSTAEIETEICVILAEVLEKPVGQIRPDTLLDEGLGVDSLALIETQVGIEERFGVVMPDIDEESVTHFRTVRDLVQPVMDQVGSSLEHA